MTVHSVTQLSVAATRERVPDLVRRRAAERAERERARDVARAEERFDWLLRARLRDATHGYPTPAELAGLHAELVEVVHRGVADGARHHHRLPRIVRLVPLVMTCVDGTVLFAFFAALIGVPLAHAFQGADLRKSLVALSLAVLGSLVTFISMTIAGRRLRAFRDPMGDVDWAGTGTTTRLLTAVAVVEALAVSVLMYVRIHLEQRPWALSTGDLALVSLVVAVIAFVGNVSVVAVHALDGSEEAAALRSAGRRLRRWERRCHAARQDLLRHERAALTPADEVVATER